MTRKELDQHVNNTHVRIREREIRDLEIKKSRAGLTEQEQASLDRALRLRDRR